MWEVLTKRQELWHYLVGHSVYVDVRVIGLLHSGELALYVDLGEQELPPQLPELGIVVVVERLKEVEYYGT